MYKYIVTICDGPHYHERGFQTSASALRRFFSICGTEAHCNYRVVYEERLSPGKSFAISNVQSITPRELLNPDFIVCPKLFTLYDNDEVLAEKFLPLESIVHLNKHL